MRVGLAVGLNFCRLAVLRHPAEFGSVRNFVGSPPASTESLMATKSFYTLEETAKRLGKTTAQVNAIADTGKLVRVEHEGQKKFRVEQVEILAASAGHSHEDQVRLSGDSHAGVIGLADSTSGSAPAMGAGSSGPGRKVTPPPDDSVLGLADSTAAGTRAGHDSSEQTGISALSGRGARGGDAIEIGLETVGSGSGLLDLTRESEETALGAELIDQVYSSDGDAAPGSSGLFDSVAPSLGNAAPHSAVGMVMAEPYDGAWSGVGTGVLVAAFAGIVVVAVIAVSVLLGGGSAVAQSFSNNLMAWAGSLAGITAVFGIVGFLVGRASE